MICSKLFFATGPTVSSWARCAGRKRAPLLDAMNTGHRGTLATIHASSAEESIHRLATLVMRGSNGLALDAIKEDVRRGIDLIVYIHREQGRRYIRQVLNLRE